MKLATFTIFTIFTILFVTLSGAEALVDPYSVKNVTYETNESLAIFETLLNFDILVETLQHPLIPDSIQVQQVHPENLDDKKENETHTQKPETKKTKVYRVTFLGVIFSLILSLIFMPFMCMMYLFCYLVSMCIFCIHQVYFLFFTGVFVFLMILFWKME